MEKVNLAEKLDRIHDYWRPKVIGELNGQEVKLVKLKGDFVWHQHPDADELFLVLAGELVIQLRGGGVTLRQGEIYIVPRGVEHRTLAYEETHVVVFEPAGTRNTGNVEHPTLTAPDGVKI